MTQLAHASVDWFGDGSLTASFTTIGIRRL